MDGVLNLMNMSVSAVVTWFTKIMDSTGAGTLYIAVMYVVLSFSILLGPLLGSMGDGLSDVADGARSWAKRESERKY